MFVTATILHRRITMRFVKIDNMKAGMRLARPVYSKNGILLYDRNSKINESGIASIKNFGLMGMFILEPAEPVPPMTQADIDFERFQTMNVYAIKQELELIVSKETLSKTQFIVADIIQNYGHLDSKINFSQDLRTKEDHIFRHTLSVAMLCAMIANKLNTSPIDQMKVVTAAVIHELGKILFISDNPSFSGESSDIPEDYMTKGFNLIESLYSDSPDIKRICVQAHGSKQKPNPNAILGAKILLVANAYDRMTAMQNAGEPASEVTAIRTLLHENVYDKKIVDALIDSVNILSCGITVELNNHEKALVLAENKDDIFRPTILTFKDNSILDLADWHNRDIEITDVQKTMDNRYVFDVAAITSCGLSTDFEVEIPDFVEAPQILE